MNIRIKEYPPTIGSAEVAELTGLSTITLKRAIKDDGFPQPLRNKGHGRGYRKWMTEEVIAWRDSNLVPA